MLGIEPLFEHGFYYDFDLGQDEQGKRRSFSPDDLAAIESHMRAIIDGRHAFSVREVSAPEALALFADQPYKIELIRDLAAGNVDDNGEPVVAPIPITVYTQDTFTDLC